MLVEIGMTRKNCWGAGDMHKMCASMESEIFVEYEISKDDEMQIIRVTVADFIQAFKLRGKSLGR